MENNCTRFYDLVAKKLSNEATPDEIVELQHLMEMERCSINDIEIVSKLWNTPLEKNDYPDVDKNWQQLSQNLFPDNSSLQIVSTSEITNRRHLSKKWLWLAAASLLVVLTTVLAFYFNNSSTHNANLSSIFSSINEVTSRNGSKTSITLSDGTKVWLNAGSRILYNKDFTSKREVYLSGEAYFDVTHDASKPFLIHAGNVNIKVLGTAFNIKAYPEDDRVETALVRGSVELTTADDPERKILLRPNEKIVILKSKITNLPKEKSSNTLLKKEELYSISRMLTYKKDSTMEDIAWMSNRLIFEGESFEQLALKMERWYDVKFTFLDDQSRKLKFTGVFDQQNIVQALQALEFSCNYKIIFHINKNQISVQLK